MIAVLKIVPITAILIIVCEFFLEFLPAIIIFRAMKRELFNLILEFNVQNINFTNLYKFIS